MPGENLLIVIKENIHETIAISKLHGVQGPPHLVDQCILFLLYLHYPLQATPNPTNASLKVPNHWFPLGNNVIKLNYDGVAKGNLGATKLVVSSKTLKERFSGSTLGNLGLIPTTRWSMV